MSPGAGRRKKTEPLAPSAPERFLRIALQAISRQVSIPGLHGGTHEESRRSAAARSGTTFTRVATMSALSPGGNPASAASVRSAATAPSAADAATASAAGQGAAPVSSSPWPALPLGEWQPTYETLHMWTQIVGKTRLALAPLQNQWWEVALYPTTNGLTTSARCRAMRGHRGHVRLPRACARHSHERWQ